MRDYNREIKDNKGRMYGYSFDFDVMQPYMLKSFRPFINKEGSALELGCHKGAFTERLVDIFDDITCVEASSEASDIVSERFGNRVKVINTSFENTKLNRTYDNILLTHVLEHLDDPVGLLRKINNEWISDNGRLLLVCPNANAPSRQIAVKMGLVSHNSAITREEEAHGHRITYSLDTLERDIRQSGLRIVHRSGIFFKALANFQWDQLLKTDIISKEYLDGCYELGQQYPDLCSSIFFVCEKGNELR